MKLSRVILISLGCFFLLGLIFFYQTAQFFDGKLHVIFCDVGQGDGIYIRTPEGMDILIDAGPNDSILSCLNSHMPFWDRTIELVFLTHPHLDHFMGLISVLQRYTVLQFNTEELSNSTVSFRQLLEEIEKENLKPRFLHSGDKFTTYDGVKILVLGPSQEFIKSTSPTGDISGSGEFASLILLVSYKGFDAITTGDSQASGISNAIKDYDLPEVEVLQVSHHGSKTGLTSQILNEVGPQMAVISVGKKNKYGHPSEKTLEILRDKETKIQRTDQNGEIEIVSDGERWGIR